MFTSLFPSRVAQFRSLGELSLRNSLFLRHAILYVFAMVRSNADIAGRSPPHTLNLEAKSVYHAAMLYYCSVVGSSSEKFALFDDDTILEAQPLFHVRHKDALKWAGREAAKQFKKARS